MSTTVLIVDVLPRGSCARQGSADTCSRHVITTQVCRQLQSSCSPSATVPMSGPPSMAAYWTDDR